MGMCGLHHLEVLPAQLLPGTPSALLVAAGGIAGEILGALAGMPSHGLGSRGRQWRVHPGRVSRPGGGQPSGSSTWPQSMPGPSLRRNVANVLVIGTGAAGLRAAIAAHQAGGEVVVVGKRRRDDAHTVLAAGGINAALGTVDPEDSWEQHFADTLREGYFLGDPGWSS